MMSHAPDTRKLLDFPAPMREHMLSNMRGHLQALNEILAALSIGDGPKAARIAETRLGVEFARRRGLRSKQRDDRPLDA